MAEILCVNGWAQPPDGLRVIAPDALHLDYRACRDFAGTTDLIATLAPTPTRAIGWSLGGSILMEAIQRGGLKPRQLVLIAPPLQFVASPDFPYGMDPLTFQLFHQNYQEDPARTAARFTGLIAKGDRDARRIMQTLSHWEGSTDALTWLPWLDKLAERSFMGVSFYDFPPTLVLHGENDNIVSPLQSRLLAKRASHVTLKLWEESGHAPHLHDPDGVQAAIEAHAREHGIA